MYQAAIMGFRTRDEERVTATPSTTHDRRHDSRDRIPLGVGSWRVNPCVLYTLVCLSVAVTIATLSYTQSVVNIKNPAVAPSFGHREIPSLLLNPPPSPSKPPLFKVEQESCPHLKDIRSLDDNRTLNLEESSINTTEAVILGDFIDGVLQAVKEGNRRIEGLQQRAREAKVPAREPILEALSSLEMTVGNYSYLPGGHWKPAHCSPRWKVAILIPFRDRQFHLPILLRYLIPMLQKQLLHFAIYVVNQENNLKFNRAMLFNVGFLEALNFTNWDCFVLHDVDHVPLSERNSYGCDHMPRHLFSGADWTHYRLPFRQFFGAVSGLTTDNIRAINGFPNAYWGWGYEDDDIFRRAAAKFSISRPKGPVGYYKTIHRHHHSAPRSDERFHLLRTWKSRFATDGLNNLKYKRRHLELQPLYTNISVDIRRL